MRRELYILSQPISMASKKASSMTNSNSYPNQSPRKCMCSPTTHPGSFRCSMHKKPPRPVVAQPSSSSSSSSSNSNYHRLDHSSMIMTSKVNNSLKIILRQIIKQPSNNDLHKRKTFQRKPTRFSVMNHVKVS